MRRIISLILAVVILALTGVCSNAYESEEFESFRSNIVLLMSLDYGEILYEKNADLRSSPSSLVKIATSIVAIDYYGSDGLDTVITANKSAIDSVPFGTIASGLKGGEELTVRQLLYYIMVQSANDAAHILAYQIGSENMRDGKDEIGSFVAMLNDFASRLECKNTVFSDCTGIDDSGNYSTARDMARIASYAAENSEFMKVCSASVYQMPETNMNSSRLLSTGNGLIVPSSSYYYRYANGMKTGASDKGRCLIATSEKDGYRYLAVVMESDFVETEDGDTTNYSLVDAKTLLSWANSKLAYVTVVDKNTVTGYEVPVENGSGVDYVRLVPGSELKKIVPKAVTMSEIKFIVDEGALPKKLNATVNKGDFVCNAKVVYNGEVLGEVELVCAQTIKMNIFLAVGSLISAVLGITVVRIIVVILIIVLIFLLVRSGINKKKKRKIRIVDKKEENNK